MSRESAWMDLAGREIRIGDYVAYAALWDRSATLKYGRVTSLKNRVETEWEWEGSRLMKSKRPGPPTIGVISVDRTYGDKWELQKEGKEVTLGFLNRLITVFPEQVPTDVRWLLGEKTLKEDDR